MTAHEFPPARPPTKPPSKPKQPTSRVPPHAFEADDQVPPDYAGRRYCAACGLAGYCGDDRHPVDALPASQRRFPPPPDEDVSARILGETEGGNA